MGLVHDNEIPARLPQTREDFVPLGQVQRGDELPLLEPLKREVGRDHDENALCETAQLELTEEQPCHDGLTGTRIIRQEKVDPREPQKIVVDGLELVRQRVNARDRDPEVGVDLVGDPEAVGLEA